MHTQVVGGRYELKEALGTGAFGAVFRAWDHRREQDVAIKLLLAPGPQAAARFDREARTIDLLDHPGIVPILDRGLAADRPFIVMPFVKGETLEAFVAREHPLAPERAMQLVHDLAEALGYAHAAGVVHRDLKPANVLVEPGDAVRIVDFGVAHLAGDARLTRTHATVGTPLFMSPEQAAGRTVDARSDVYALGALLHFALTGRPPLDAGSGMELLAAIHRRTPEPPSRDRPDLPAQLDAICARALAKDPDDRYPSADALAAALRTGASPSRRLPAIALATALLISGGAVFLALRTSGEPPEPSARPPAAPSPTVATAPTPSVDAQRQTFRRLLDQAKRLRAEGALAEALQRIEEAIAIDANRHTLSSKAALLAETGRVKQAVALYAELVERYPRDADIKCDYGKWLMAVGRKPEAKRQIEHALRLAPADPDVTATAGWSLWEIDFDKARAVRMWQRSLELGPTSDALAGLAFAANREGKFEASLQLAEQALKINPRSGVAEEARASCLLQLRRLPEARLALRRLVASNPTQWKWQQGLFHVETRLATTRPQRERVLRWAQGILRRIPTNHPIHKSFLRDVTRFERFVRQGR